MLSTRASPSHFPGVYAAEAGVVWMNDDAISSRSEYEPRGAAAHRTAESSPVRHHPHGAALALRPHEVAAAGAVPEPVSRRASAMSFGSALKPEHKLFARLTSRSFTSSSASLFSTLSFQGSGAGAASASASGAARDTALRSLFPHAAAQRLAAHRLCQRIRVQCDFLEEIGNFMERMAKVDDAVGKEYRRLGTNMTRALEAKGKMAAAHSSPGTAAAGTEQYYYLDKQAGADLAGTVAQLSVEYRANAVKLEKGLLAETRALRKVQKRRLEPIVARISAALTKAYNARTNIATQLAEYESNLHFLDNAQPSETQATPLRSLPQDPYLTSVTLQKNMAKGAAIEAETAGLLSGLLREVETLDAEFQGQVQGILVKWRELRDKMVAVEMGTLDTLAQRSTAILDRSFNAFTVEMDLENQLTPPDFAQDNSMARLVAPPSLKQPVFAGPLLRPPRRSALTGESTGAWQLTYAVLTQHGYLHLFGGMAHIDEEPLHVQERVLTRLAAKRDISDPNMDPAKLGLSHLHLSQSHLTSKLHKSGESGVDLSSYYLLHPRTRIRRSQQNLHCIELTFPVLERHAWALGKLGKRKERGNQATLLLKATDEAQWDSWVYHLTSIAAGPRADAGQYDAGCAPDEGSNVDASDDFVRQQQQAQEEQQQRLLVALRADLPDAPDLAKMW